MADEKNPQGPSFGTDKALPGGLWGWNARPTVFQRNAESEGRFSDIMFRRAKGLP